MKDAAAEVMDFEQFIAETMSSGLKSAKTPAKSAEKTAEDIMAELMPLVEADKKKGG